MVVGLEKTTGRGLAVVAVFGSVMFPLANWFLRRG